MRDIERAAIESGRVTGRDLMARAGQGGVDAVLAQWPELARGIHRAIVLCGPGNNGGDGFVVARLLKEQGWDVAVYAQGWDMLWQDNYLRPEAPPDARKNAECWQAIGGRSAPLDAQYGFDLCADGQIVVIDALLGIGQNRDTDPILQNWGKQWELMCNVSPDNHVHRVSIDVPTGYQTDSGALLGDHPFQADLIVTFHAMKPVHMVLSKLDDRCVVKDIGL